MSLLDVLGAESINPLSIDVQSLMHVLYDCGEDSEYITALQSIYVEVNHNCLTNDLGNYYLNIFKIIINRVIEWENLMI